MVQFKNNVRTADIYVTVNHTLNFDKGKCTVENVISEEIKATTTVTEKDPDKLYLDFSKYVHHRFQHPYLQGTDEDRRPLVQRRRIYRKR